MNISKTSDWEFHISALLLVFKWTKKRGKQNFHGLCGMLKLFFPNEKYRITSKKEISASTRPMEDISLLLFQEYIRLTF